MHRDEVLQSCIAMREAMQLRQRRKGVQLFKKIFRGTALIRSIEIRFVNQSRLADVLGPPEGEGPSQL